MFSTNHGTTLMLSKWWRLLVFPFFLVFPIVPSDFQVTSLNVYGWFCLPEHLLFFHRCAWGFVWVSEVSDESSQGWLTTELQHLLMVIIFLGPLFFPLANSKSEGSPVLPHEPSKVKPEESREITRPSRPAVSAFFSKELWALFIHQRTHGVK